MPRNEPNIVLLQAAMVDEMEFRKLWLCSILNSHCATHDSTRSSEPSSSFEGGGREDVGPPASCRFRVHLH